MIYAVIDIGSNTIRLSVFKNIDGKVKNLFNEKEQASLRNYIKDGKLSNKGIKRLLETLETFKNLIDNFDDIDAVYPFATASIRDASNRSEILSLVKEKLDFDIQILSEEDESRLSFVGANSSMEVKKGVLTDIGGGSSEIVIIEQSKVIKAASLPIGSLSAFSEYVNYLFADKKSKKEIEKKLDQLLDDYKMYKEKHTTLCGVGGSARASLKLYNEYYNLDTNNFTMERKKLKKLIKELINMDNKDLLHLILSVKGDRVHTLIPGMIILNRIAKHFSTEYINISQTGVREGFVYSKIIGSD